MRDLAPYKKAARTLVWTTRTEIDTLCTLNAVQAYLDGIPSALRIPQRNVGRWHTAYDKAKVVLFNIDRQRKASPDRKARDAARILLSVVAGALAYPLSNDDPRYRRNLVGRAVGQLLKADKSWLYGQPVRIKIITKGSSRLILDLADALMPVVKWWANAERKVQIQAIVDVHRTKAEPMQSEGRVYYRAHAEPIAWFSGGYKESRCQKPLDRTSYYEVREPRDSLYITSDNPPLPLLP
jgi:hypothetical protein